MDPIAPCPPGTWQDQSSAGSILVRPAKASYKTPQMAAGGGFDRVGPMAHSELSPLWA